MNVNFYKFSWDEYTKRKHELTVSMSDGSELDSEIIRKGDLLTFFVKNHSYPIVVSLTENANKSDNEYRLCFSAPKLSKGDYLYCPSKDISIIFDKISDDNTVVALIAFNTEKGDFILGEDTHLDSKSFCVMELNEIENFNHWMSVYGWAYDTEKQELFKRATFEEMIAIENPINYDLINELKCGDIIVHEKNADMFVYGGIPSCIKNSSTGELKPIEFISLAHYMPSSNYAICTDVQTFIFSGYRKATDEEKADFIKQLEIRGYKYDEQNGTVYSLVSEEEKKHQREEYLQSVERSCQLANNIVEGIERNKTRSEKRSKYATDYWFAPLLYDSYFDVFVELPSETKDFIKSVIIYKDMPTKVVNEMFFKLYTSVVKATSVESNENNETEQKDKDFVFGPCEEDASPSIADQLRAEITNEMTDEH